MWNFTYTPESGSIPPATNPIPPQGPRDFGGGGAGGGGGRGGGGSGTSLGRTTLGERFLEAAGGSSNPWLSAAVGGLEAYIGLLNPYTMGHTAQRIVFGKSLWDLYREDKAAGRVSHEFVNWDQALTWIAGGTGLARTPRTLGPPQRLLPGLSQSTLTKWEQAAAHYGFEMTYHGIIRAEMRGFSPKMIITILRSQAARIYYRSADDVLDYIIEGGMARGKSALVGVSRGSFPPKITSVMKGRSLPSKRQLSSGASIRVDIE